MMMRGLSGLPPVLASCALFFLPMNAWSDPSSIQSKTVFCESMPAPATGACTVTSGDGALRLKGIVLATDTIFTGGEVLVDPSGLIQYVGCSAARPASLSSMGGSPTKIDGAHGVIPPGLINTHDHLSFDHN